MFKMVQICARQRRFASEKVVTAVAYIEQKSAFFSRWPKHCPDTTAAVEQDERQYIHRTG
jgi:hypothetical protein